MRKSLLIVSAITMFLLMSINTAASNDYYVAPQEVQAAAIEYGNEYGMGPYILLAIMRYESCYIPDVANGNCKGLMQVNDKIHKGRMERLGVTDIYDVNGNIHVGADYLAELYESYGDWGIVLGCYHGEKKAVSNGRKGIYSKYTLKILAYADDLAEQEGITDGQE